MAVNRSKFSVLLLLGLCILVGTGSAAPSTRVVNGSDALNGEFPYMASLRNRLGSHTCGATIIHEEWILTAAHCIFSENPEDYSIQYGTNEISRDGPFVSKVQRVIMHQGYDNNNNFIHDIALIKLEEPMVFSEYVQAVALPDYMELVSDGEIGQLLGWGYNDTLGVLQNWLQKAELTTVTDDACREIHFEKVHFTNICAGVVGGGKGQCTGDSGGPLIVDNKQVGIVSWSVKPCTYPGYPGVYTEVTYYVGWLREHTGIARLGRN